MRARICPFSKRMWTDVKRDWCQSRRELRLRLRIKHGHISTPSAARSDGRKTRETDGRFAKFPKGIHGSLESTRYLGRIARARGCDQPAARSPSPLRVPRRVPTAAETFPRPLPPRRPLAYRPPFPLDPAASAPFPAPYPRQRAGPSNSDAIFMPRISAHAVAPRCRTSFLSDLSVSLPPCLSPSPCSLAVTPRAGNLISCPARAGDIAVARDDALRKIVQNAPAILKFDRGHRCPRPVRVAREPAEPPPEDIFSAAP